jgi:hypothetical protein
MANDEGVFDPASLLPIKRFGIVFRIDQAADLQLNPWRNGTGKDISCLDSPKLTAVDQPGDLNICPL